jgi:hypothetical protein
MRDATSGGGGLDEKRRNEYIDGEWKKLIMTRLKQMVPFGPSSWESKLNRKLVKSPRNLV